MTDLKYTLNMDQKILLTLISGLCISIIIGSLIDLQNSDFGIFFIVVSIIILFSGGIPLIAIQKDYVKEESIDSYFRYGIVLFFIGYFSIIAYFISKKYIMIIGMSILLVLFIVVFFIMTIYRKNDDLPKN
jgi:glucose uptake protein GlcU